MAKYKNYDFAGWATKCNIRCTDNRTIMENAFAEQDGERVPLVYNHDHNNVGSVLGHAMLENRKEGVYCYCYFNDTENGKIAKEQVKHGDIRCLSIYANQLKQNGYNVVHGKIREVSLVMAGANCGAYIDTVVAHSDEHDEEAVIYHPYDDEFEFYHAEEGDNIEMPKEEELMHEDAPKAEDEEEAGGKTVKEIYEGLTDEQKEAVDYIVGIAVQNAKAEAAQHSDEDEENLSHSEEGEDSMKKNIFEGGQVPSVSAELMHSAFAEINENAKRCGDFRTAFKEYIADCEDEALAHSITNVGYLFPEAKLVKNVPDTIHDNDTWIAKVMGGVHHTPFSRIKNTAINITADEARAKGYVKGNQKVEEVVVALKRTTDPQTVYKYQKMDRDDVIDIVDFDVIAWLKGEMRYKLDEELARAILIGDGRDASSDDKIDPTHIRPIYGDNNVYTITKDLVRVTGATDEEYAKAAMEKLVRARKEYKGSGNPTLFCGEDFLADMQLIKDVNGHYLYRTVQEICTFLRVKEIVTAPCLDGVVRTDATETYDYKLNCIMVNLADYNVGADKGGQVNMFDDFNLEYNKQQYLIETRCSGALIKPYSAIVLEEKVAHVAG